MVPILDGNSEISAHVRSDLCRLICLRQMIQFKDKSYFYLQKDLFPFMLVRNITLKFKCHEMALAYARDINSKITHNYNDYKNGHFD